MLTAIQPIADFAQKAEFIHVLEYMRESNIFTPLVGYNFTEQMLAIIETEDSAHFLDAMASEGVLTYTRKEPTEYSHQHTCGNYLKIDTVDMDNFLKEAQTYVDNCKAPMAGPLAQYCQPKELKLR